MNRSISLFALLLITGPGSCAFAQSEDLAAAVAAGRVSVTIQAIGGSSGDTIKATIRTIEKAGGELVLTVAAGTRLKCGDSSAQNMVIAGVEGQLRGPNHYSPSRVIRADASPKTFVFDAYCTDFEKNNPSSGTAFSLGKVDPVLACILHQSNSTVVKQAAVWIYTDNASFSHVNEKFEVNRSDWDAATAIDRECVKSSRND